MQNYNKNINCLNNLNKSIKNKNIFILKKKINSKKNLYFKKL